MAVTVICAGCGRPAAPEDRFPARCRGTTAGDDIDHVMVRRLDLARVELIADDDPNPFVRYRQTFRAWHVARSAGWTDERYVGLVRRIDDAIAAVDGHGFRVSPFGRAEMLSDALRFEAPGGIWVKDETAGVAGSHKARHLMGVLLELHVAESLDASLESRPLAIASCGNAALAAAVVAHAAGRRLDVFVPPDAEPAVLDRLHRLGARVELVRRAAGETGDPTVHRMHAAIDAGAVPFTCQGSDDGLAIEGGETLGLEIAEAAARDGVQLDRVLVQVGGGALASGVAGGLALAATATIIPAEPRLDTVQTTGAWPLRRAYRRVVEALAERGVTVAGPIDRAAPAMWSVLDDAAHHRSHYMWPWESEPRSIAHGILDDETYDWLAVVDAMLRTGGRPLVVDEADLLAAGELAVRTTAIDADETGTAGLAGLLHLQRERAIGPDERVALLFTGVRRHPSTAAVGTATDLSPDRSAR
jgi:threonine dehydratase